MQSLPRRTVGIATDTTGTFGRQIMLGFLRYANVLRRWRLVEEILVASLDPLTWPQCDGAVVAWSDTEKLQKFRQRCAHVVNCSGEMDPALGIPVVTVDNLQVGRRAAEHLLICGLKHFGFYSGHLPRVSARRLEGFRQVLAARNLTCAVSPVQHSYYLRDRTTTRPHWPALIAWLQSLPKPVGILAWDDAGARDLAAACLDANISVPDAVAIIGVNNDDLVCEGSYPPLSSVAVDFTKVGYNAAALLDRMLAGAALTPHERWMQVSPHDVVRRASTDMLAIEDTHVAAALEFIRKHACDPCSVPQVLAQVPLHRREMECRFVQSIGRTPLQEILRVRIEAAARLVADSDLPLKQIAGQCGFESTHSFHRAFLRLTRESPGAYRRARQKAGGPRKV